MRTKGLSPRHVSHRIGNSAAAPPTEEEEEEDEEDDIVDDAGERMLAHAARARTALLGLCCRVLAIAIRRDKVHCGRLS